jgi:CHAD domain-containing protein
MQLQEFAQQRTQELLERVRKEVAKVSQQQNDAEAIHDLRVAIRRLTQALRALQGVFPKKETKRVRRKLRGMMDLAAEIRNRDIAMELLGKAGVAADASPVAQRLAAERDAVRGDLVLLARQWKRRHVVDGWLKEKGRKG